MEYSDFKIKGGDKNEQKTRNKLNSLGFSDVVNDIDVCECGKSSKS